MRRMLICVTLVSGVALLSCEEERNDTPLLPTATPEVEDVVDDSDRFYGHQVTLVGEVDEVFNERAFELEDMDWIFDDELTIVTARPVKLGTRRISDDDEVIVTGTVHSPFSTTMRTELGWDIDSELGEIEGPILVAESIRKVDEYASWSASEPENATVSLWALYIEPDPLKFRDQMTSFSDVTVRSKMGKGLWVGHNHLAQVFVAPPEGVDLGAIQMGDEVRLVGHVKAMPEADEAIRKWGLPQTMKQQVSDADVYIDATTLEKIDKENERRADLGMEGMNDEESPRRANLGMEEMNDEETRRR